MNKFQKIIDRDCEMYDSANEKNVFTSSEKKFEKLCKKILPKFLSNERTNIKIFNFTYLLFSSEWGGVRADLFAISSDYKYFSIIEVELSQHHFEDHVVPQMKSIISSNFKDVGHKIFDHLKRHNKDFGYEKNKFHNMIEIVEPEFITISEKYVFSWETSLIKLGVRYMGLTQFENDMRENVYHLKDTQPRKDIKNVRVEWLGDYFQIIGRQSKIFKNNEIHVLKFKKIESTFTVYRKTQKKIYLIPYNFNDKVFKLLNGEYQLDFYDGMFNVSEVN
mgnify:CR=1 FL=1|tara:strand:- start:4144 stop:4974 length:831 start_codon:yes stop_codon:yes gene_type:complete